MKTPKVVRITDPTARVDIAAARLLEVAVRRSGDPLVAALYGVLKTDIEKHLKRGVGPRSYVGKTARQAVQTLRKMRGAG